MLYNVASLSHTNDILSELKFIPCCIYAVIESEIVI